MEKLPWYYALFGAAFVPLAALLKPKLYVRAYHDGVGPCKGGLAVLIAIVALAAIGFMAMGLFVVASRISSPFWRNVVIWGGAFVGALIGAGAVVFLL